MKNFKKDILLIVVMLFFCSCASLRDRVSYTAFGEASPSADNEVVETFVSYVETKKNVDSIKVLSNTLPDGAINNGDEIKMDPQRGKAIGKFNLKFSPSDSSSTKFTAIERAKKLTVAAGGNLAVVNFVKDYEDPRRLHAASGFIFKIKNPKAENKKL